MSEIQSKASQCQKIIRFMREHGAITPLQAMNEFGCMRLAARINDIRRGGIGINVRALRVPTREGKPAKVDCYSLADAVPMSDAALLRLVRAVVQPVEGA